MYWFLTCFSSNIRISNKSEIGEDSLVRIPRGRIFLENVFVSTTRNTSLTVYARLEKEIFWKKLRYIRRTWVIVFFLKGVTSRKILLQCQGFAICICATTQRRQTEIAEESVRVLISKYDFFIVYLFYSDLVWSGANKLNNMYIGT